MLYRFLLRPLFKRMPQSTLSSLLAVFAKINSRTRFQRSLLKLLYSRRYPALSREIMGLGFNSPLGIASGIDRDGTLVSTLSAMGYSYLQIGPVSRLTADGQNGVMKTIAKLKEEQADAHISANIAPSPDIEPENILQDIEYSFSMMYDFVDFITVNFCTSQRAMTDLTDIMDVLLEKRLLMEIFKPILVQIPGSTPPKVLDDVLSYCLASGVDGLVVRDSNEDRNFEAVSSALEKAKGKMEIISSGAASKPVHVKKLLDAGAALVETYSGFIHRGPSFAKSTLSYLNNSKTKAL